MKLFGSRKSDQPRVAVLGGMRSGTNVVSAMLQYHWDIVVDDAAYGWKHGGVPVFSPSSALTYPQIPIVYVTKNPYAFVASLFRYSSQAHEKGQNISLEGARDFNDFVRSPVMLTDSQLDGSPQMIFANPIQYWNYINWNLETLDKSRFQAIGFNYEDLIVAPDILRGVEQIVKTRRRPSAISLPGQVLDRNAGRNARKTINQRFDTAYYILHRYLDEFSEEQIAFIHDQSDPRLLSARRYDTILAS